MKNLKIRLNPSTGFRFFQVLVYGIVGVVSLIFAFIMKPILAQDGAILVLILFILVLMGLFFIALESKNIFRSQKFLILNKRGVEILNQFEVEQSFEWESVASMRLYSEGAHLYLAILFPDNKELEMEFTNKWWLASLNVESGLKETYNSLMKMWGMNLMFIDRIDLPPYLELVAEYKLEVPERLVDLMEMDESSNVKIKKPRLHP